MIPGSSRCGNWWHRRCLQREEALLRDRDRADGEVLRLRKQYEDLLVAYRGLADSAVLSLRPPPSLMQALFEEEAPPEDRKTFLTPAWKDREGEPA